MRSMWTYPEDRYYYGWYDDPENLQPADGDLRSIIVDRLHDTAGPGTTSSGSTGSRGW